MDKTAHVFAPQIARHVNLPTAHVVVMLVGWGLTVVLVLYFENFLKNTLTFKINLKHKMVHQLYILKYIGFNDTRMCITLIL